jgi:hypothetical protein
MVVLAVLAGCGRPLSSMLIMCLTHNIISCASGTTLVTLVQASTVAQQAIASVRTVQVIGYGVTTVPPACPLPASHAD